MFYLFSLHLSSPRDKHIYTTVPLRYQLNSITQLPLAVQCTTTSSCYFPSPAHTAQTPPLSCEGTWDRRGTVILCVNFHSNSSNVLCKTQNTAWNLDGGVWGWNKCNTVCFTLSVVGWESAKDWEQPCDTSGLTRLLAAWALIWSPKNSPLWFPSLFVQLF